MRITKSMTAGDLNGSIVNYIEGSLDSTETKPSDNIADGSILVESDTGKVYFFNEKSATWVEQFSFQG